MKVFALIAILLPFFTAFCALFFMRESSSRFLILFTLVVLSLSSLLLTLTLLTDSPPVLCFFWLASAGEMCISFQRSPLLLLNLITLSLIVLFALNLDKSRKFNTKDAFLILFSFTSLQIALLSEHFLLRYAALEMVGLSLVAAALFLHPFHGERWKNASLAFLNLKVGDLALLIAIFVMSTDTGGFEISANLANAVSLPHASLYWIAISLLVAVWIKMAVWPLSIWSDLNSSLPSHVRFWLLRTSLPILGAYLLYRSLPIIQTLPSFKVWIPLLCILAWLADFHGMRSPPRLVRSQFHFSSLCLLLVSPFASPSDFFFLLIAWVIARLPLAYVETLIEKANKPFSWRESLAALISMLWVNLIMLGILLQVVHVESVDLWIKLLMASLWWAQLLHTLHGLRDLSRSSQTVSDKRVWKKFGGKLVVSIIALSLLSMVLNAILNFSAGWIRGSSFSIWLPASGWLDISTAFPFFMVSLVLGFSLWIAANFLFHLLQRFHRLSEKIQNSPRIFLPKRKRWVGDPLDIYGKAMDLVVSGARWVYLNVEGGGVDSMFANIGRGLKRIFTSFENFNSAVLWSKLLGFIKKRTRNLQQMHAGFLRQNLVLMFVFIFMLMIFLWLNMEGIVF